MSCFTSWRAVSLENREGNFCRPEGDASGTASGRAQAQQNPVLVGWSRQMFNGRRSAAWTLPPGSQWVHPK